MYARNVLVWPACVRARIYVRVWVYARVYIKCERVRVLRGRVNVRVYACFNCHICVHAFVCGNTCTHGQ